METRRVVRCIVLSPDANEAEAVAGALHARFRSSHVVISAAVSADRALDWIMNDPTGNILAIVLLDHPGDVSPFEDCLLAASRRHPSVALFATRYGPVRAVPTLPLDATSVEELADNVATRLGLNRASQ